MSKLGVTMVDGSTKDVLRGGLAQQRMMLADRPFIRLLRVVTYFFFLSVFLLLFLMTGWVLVNSAYRTKTTVTATVRLESFSISYIIRRRAICCMETFCI